MLLQLLWLHGLGAVARKGELLYLQG